MFDHIFASQIFSELLKFCQILRVTDLTWTWGWQSDEEMAEVWMGIIPKDWRDTRALNAAAARTWYNADNQAFPD